MTTRLLSIALSLFVFAPVASAAATSCPRRAPVCSGVSVCKYGTWMCVASAKVKTTNCSAIMCANGSQYPSCFNGMHLNYFIDPCKILKT